MKTITSRMLLTGLVLCASAANGSNSMDTCCRDAALPIEYEFPGFHVRAPNDSNIIRVEGSGDEVTLTIRSPTSRPYDPYFSGPYKDRITTDRGRTWRNRSPETPSLLGRLGNNTIQAPSNPKVVYHRLKDIGKYLRTEDGGATWQLPQHSIDGMSSQQFASHVGGNTSYVSLFHLAGIHPQETMTLFATITVWPWGTRAFGSKMPLHDLPGMYVSHDGGESWSNFSDLPKNYTPLGISPINPDVMYAQTEKGVVKTTDGGKHWAPVGQQQEMNAAPVVVSTDSEKSHRFQGDAFEVRQFVLDPTDEDIVYVVSNKGVYRSLDGGHSWCLLDLGFDVFGSIYSLGVNPGNPEELFTGTIYGAFYSKDRGLHWEKIYPPQSDGSQ